MRTHPIERYQALRDSAPCFSRPDTPPEGHQIGARKRRAPGNTILSQPYRRRGSTVRLNRKGSQLATSLEGEPGYTRRKDPPTLIPRNQVIMSEGKGPEVGCTYVCIVIASTYSRVLTKRVKVVNPARGQLSRENEYFPVPVRAREFGLARRVRQSRPASACSISILRPNLVLTYWIPLDFRGGVHLFIPSTVSRQSRADQVTLLHTDGVEITSSLFCLAIVCVCVCGCVRIKRTHDCFSICFFLIYISTRNATCTLGFGFQVSALLQATRIVN